MPTFTEIAPLIAAIASLLPWVLASILLWVYRKQLGEFIRTTKSANLPGGIQVERYPLQLVEKLEELKESVEEVEHLLKHDTLYVNYRRAFVDAEDIVRSYLKAHQGIDDVLEIRILAVGMTYSWEHFVKDIPKWMEKTYGCRLDLKLLLVNPTLLNNLELKHSPYEIWYEQGQQRMVDIKQFIEDIKKFEGRITITMKSYENLPFWHGVLINGEHLFVGRTDWDLTDTRPMLSVGQNAYRYYQKSKDKDSQVIRFEHWHRYFFEFHSCLIATKDRDRDGLGSETT